MELARCGIASENCVVFGELVTKREIKELESGMLRSESQHSHSESSWVTGQML